MKLLFYISDHEINPFVDSLKSASVTSSLSKKAVIKDPVMFATSRRH